MNIKIKSRTQAAILLDAIDYEAIEQKKSRKMSVQAIQNVKVLKPIIKQLYAILDTPNWKKVGTYKLDLCN